MPRKSRIFIVTYKDKVIGGSVCIYSNLFVVPVFYIIFEFLQEKIRKPMEEEADVQVLLEKEKSEVERELRT